jgi:flotillin
MVIVAIAAMVLMVTGWVVMMIRFYRRIGPNEALVVTTPNGAIVARRGRLILPFLHTAESIDLATKQLRVERKGRDAPTSKDGVQTDLVVVFYLHVNEVEDDILKVARKIGADRLRDASALKELLAPQLAASVDTLTRSVAFETFERDRDRLEEELRHFFADGLDGLTLDRAVIERVERTPVEQAGPFR